MSLSAAYGAGMPAPGQSPTGNTKWGVMRMFGIGLTLGSHLIAKIENVRRFHSIKALVAFAGIDAPPYQFSQTNIRSRSIFKCGSSSLRRILFLVKGVLLQNKPLDNPVYGQETDCGEALQGLHDGFCQHTRLLCHRKGLPGGAANCIVTFRNAWLATGSKQGR